MASISLEVERRNEPVAVAERIERMPEVLQKHTSLTSETE